MVCNFDPHACGFEADRGTVQTGRLARLFTLSFSILSAKFQGACA